MQSVSFKDPVRTDYKKNNQLMLYKAKVAVCSEINIKHTNTVSAECTAVEC